MPILNTLCQRWATMSKNVYTHMLGNFISRIPGKEINYPQLWKQENMHANMLTGGRPYISQPTLWTLNSIDGTSHGWAGACKVIAS